MTVRDDDLRVRPGRIQYGNRGAKRPKTFVPEVMRTPEEGRAFRQNFQRHGHAQ